MIKKNVPYKVLKGLWIAEMILALINIIALWVAWGKGTNAAIAFDVVVGVFTCLVLVAMTICAFLNQLFNVRKHGWAYGLLAAIHLVFAIVTAVLTGGEDKATPALFTVFLVAIIAIGVYLALKNNNPFRKKDYNGSFTEATIAREDLGSNPSFDKANEVTGQIESGEKKPARDEKTGIVSL